MKNNVTSLLELHNTIYAAAAATVRMSGGKIKTTWIIYKINKNPTMGKKTQETNQ
jgi:hypothetical protein